MEKKKVSAEDLGNNFLVSARHLGQPRAAAVAELARELNEDVPGSSIVADPASWLFGTDGGGGGGGNGGNSSSSFPDVS